MDLLNSSTCPSCRSITLAASCRCCCAMQQQPSDPHATITAKVINHSCRRQCRCCCGAWATTSPPWRTALRAPSTAQRPELQRALSSRSAPGPAMHHVPCRSCDWDGCGPASGRGMPVSCHQLCTVAHADSAVQVWLGSSMVTPSPPGVFLLFHRALWTHAVCAMLQNMLSSPRHASMNSLVACACAGGIPWPARLYCTVGRCAALGAVQLACSAAGSNCVGAHQQRENFAFWDTPVAALMFALPCSARAQQHSEGR